MAEESIQGYDEFQATLKDITKQLPDQLKKAAQDIARDWINAAKNAAGPHARGPAMALQIGNDQQGAVITNNHPMFYGEEFGGQSRPATMMFPPYQGQRGYFFYPAARANADKFNKVWDAAIDQATKSWDHQE